MLSGDTYQIQYTVVDIIITIVEQYATVDGLELLVFIAEATTGRKIKFKLLRCRGLVSFLGSGAHDFARVWATTPTTAALAANFVGACGVIRRFS